MTERCRSLLYSQWVTTVEKKPSDALEQKRQRRKKCWNYARVTWEKLFCYLLWIDSESENAAVLFVNKISMRYFCTKQQGGWNHQKTPGETGVSLKVSWEREITEERWDNYTKGVHPQSCNRKRQAFRQNALEETLASVTHCARASSPGSHDESRHGNEIAEENG